MDLAQENAIEIAKWLKRTGYRKESCLSRIQRTSRIRDHEKNRQEDLEQCLHLNLRRKNMRSISLKSKNDQICRKSWWGGNTDPHIQ